MMAVRDADLKLKSHESNFKISIENSYQNPKRGEKLTVQGTQVVWARRTPHHTIYVVLSTQWE
jgi:hypothetical protein